MANFNYTFGDGFDTHQVTWQYRLIRNLTIIDGEVDGIVSFDVSDTTVLKLESATAYLIESAVFPQEVEVIFRGIYPGRKHLIVSYTPPDSDKTEIGRNEVSCIVGGGVLNTIASYVFIIWLIISYVTMGCKMDLKTISEKLRPPWGVLIGMFSQFIIMPALAFGLTRVFDLEPATAVGLILVGTCPGGWISNVLTVLFDCDFVLSLTMTAFSTVIAMAMMPLNLFLYVQIISGVDENLDTPFAQLILQLVLLILPLGIGVGLAYKWPSLNTQAEKLLKPFATILVLVAVGFGIPTQVYVFYVDYKGWLVSLLLPFLGAFMGLAIARIIAQDFKTSITIAFETACQNALLAKTMANLFYPKPESDLIGVLPLLVAVLTAAEGLFAAIIYTAVKKIRARRQGDQSDAVPMTKNGAAVSNGGNNNTSTNKDEKADKDQPDGNTNPGFEA